jgi:hypothetical protein
VTLIAPRECGLALEEHQSEQRQADPPFVTALDS